MYISKLAIPRRTFLRGVGTALALPLLDAMVPALTATVKTAANPVRRFGVVYVPNGITMAAWTPRAAGTEFELTPIGAVGYQVQATSSSFFTGYVNVVPLGDDQVIDQVLPFPFPNPGGVCTTAGFCSNGFVWMDNFNNGAPAAPFVPAFLSEGPRISALWTDLDLTAGGTAYFDATATAAYFTWFDAPDYYNPTLRSTFQIQLFSDGRIKLCYQGLNLGANRPARKSVHIPFEKHSTYRLTTRCGVLNSTIWLNILHHRSTRSSTPSAMPRAATCCASSPPESARSGNSPSLSRFRSPPRRSTSRLWRAPG